MIICSLIVCTAQQQSCALDISENNYTWETWNYYEILGFEEPTSSASTRQRRKERKLLESKDVRKAYRKQAQAWHPDKLNNKNGTASVSVEESNARFGRIAEAYEVLNDAETREAYDEYLSHCEDYQKQQQKRASTTNSKWSSFVEKIKTDPRKVFENFIYGDDDAADDDDQHNLWRDSNPFHGGGNGGPTDPFASFSSFYENGRSSSQQQQQRPINVYENKEVLYNPYTGEEVIRIYRTEEFPPEGRSSGRFYYRILAQEFTEQYDPYYGSHYIQPISEPYLVEDGYRQSNNNSQSPQVLSNTLHPGEILTPDSTKILTSSNKRYYARLSSNCELLVILDNSMWKDKYDEQIWSSENTRPIGECYATLKGANLLVALGSPGERPKKILWNSNDDPNNTATTAMDDDDEGNGPAPQYVVELDNDGSLTVYSIRMIPSDLYTSPWADAFSNVVSKLPPQTGAAKAFDATRKWFSELLIVDQDEPRFVTVKTCIHATSPMGCNRPARLLLQLSKEMTFQVKRTVRKLDRLVDRIVDSFESYFEMYEDEDVVDVFFRVLNDSVDHWAKMVREKFDRLRRQSNQ
jgi:curved DNA-binding protein CbpA